MLHPGSDPLRRTGRALSFVIATAGVLVAASCTTQGSSYRDYRDCDEVVRRCRTVCDYWCDAWGCYPMCWDQCWDDCYVFPDPPSATPPASDAATPPPPATSDGGTRPDAGNGAGALCTTCVSNADCASGALCIVRGGPRPDASTADAGAPAGAGFCGQACAGTADCPDGFACSQLGSVHQCIPTSGKCE